MDLSSPNTSGIYIPGNIQDTGKLNDTVYTHKPEPKKQKRYRDYEPDFLKKKLDGLYVNRYLETWKGNLLFKVSTPDDNDLDLRNNDYLCLSRHPDVISAKVESLNTSANSIKSGIYQHSSTLKKQFEKEFSILNRSDGSLLCQSGWSANSGLLFSICGDNTPVYIDSLAHASFAEGIQCASARQIVFNHNDTKHLETLLRRYGPGIITVDSVYSQNGNICPLKKVSDIAEAYASILVVDETHAYGVFGDEGEGLSASLHLENKVHFRTASLSKAFITRAGIISGSVKHLEFIQHESRTALFSSAPVDCDIAGLLVVLKLIRKSNKARETLAEYSKYVRKGLHELGYNIELSQAQIIGLQSGTEERTLKLRSVLETNGIYGSPFFYPATPRDQSELRFSLNSGLEQEALHHLIHVCAEIRSEIELRDWESTRRLNALNH